MSIENWTSENMNWNNPNPLEGKYHEALRLAVIERCKTVGIEFAELYKNIGENMPAGILADTRFLKKIEAKAFELTPYFLDHIAYPEESYPGDGEVPEAWKKSSIFRASELISPDISALTLSSNFASKNWFIKMHRLINLLRKTYRYDAGQGISVCYSVKFDAPGGAGGSSLSEAVAEAFAKAPYYRDYFQSAGNNISFGAGMLLYWNGGTYYTASRNMVKGKVALKRTDPYWAEIYGTDLSKAVWKLKAVRRTTFYFIAYGGAVVIDPTSPDNHYENSIYEEGEILLVDGFQYDEESGFYLSQNEYGADSPGGLSISEDMLRQAGGYLGVGWGLVPDGTPSWYEVIDHAENYSFFTEI